MIDRWIEPDVCDCEECTPAKPDIEWEEEDDREAASFDYDAELDRKLESIEDEYARRRHLRHARMSNDILWSA